jgi:hypothetical protein
VLLAISFLSFLEAIWSGNAVPDRFVATGLLFAAFGIVLGACRATNR